jgi:hypothetical protein
VNIAANLTEASRSAAACDGPIARYAADARIAQDREVSIGEVAKAVVAAARMRSAALVAGDRRRLAALLHPQLRWTTYRGVVLDREQYLAANVGGDLIWVGQALQDIDVQVVGDAVAVLTALVVDVVGRDGLQETFRLRLTQTWVNTVGGWQCLSGHAGPQVG